MMSNFQVEYGRDESGNLTEDTLVRVPIRYGDASRQAQTIIQQNSANNLPSTPLMTFYINALTYDRERIQEPYFVDKINVRQRYYNTESQTYETSQGNAFTIERLMPVPYKLNITLDIWTSNTNQKMQLLEQLLTLFNPGLEIQSTENYIDWTSLSVCYLDDVTWTNRTIPINAENPIDIATLKFSLPIWLSSPAKIKKLGVVERIIMSIYDSAGDAALAVLDNDLLLGTRQKITPYGYQVLLLNNQLQILKPSDVISQPATSLTPPNSPVDDQIVWPSVINLYGVLRPGISYVTLDNPWEPDREIIGTVALNPADERFLMVTIDPDTVPANTLAPIDAVINPLLSGPGDGLDSSMTGQRYLLTEATGSIVNAQGASDVNPPLWKGTGGQPLIAQENDIIEYDGVRWRVVFDASVMEETQYVTNINTGIQYKWVPQDPAISNDESMWVKSYDGLYQGGSWNLIL